MVGVLLLAVQQPAKISLALSILCAAPRLLATARSRLRQNGSLCQTREAMLDLTRCLALELWLGGSRVWPAF
eukprot:6490518-Amphidinium_carterae.2